MRTSTRLLTTHWTMTIQIRRLAGLSIICVHIFYVSFEFEIVLSNGKSTRSQRFVKKTKTKMSLSLVSNLAHDVLNVIAARFQYGCGWGIKLLSTVKRYFFFVYLQYTIYKNASKLADSDYQSWWFIYFSFRILSFDLIDPICLLCISVYSLKIRKYMWIFYCRRNGYLFSLVVLIAYIFM